MANDDIPPQGVALLNAIAGTESPAYNVINGGSRFSSYADHPRILNAATGSTAAGRYQFIGSTWDRARDALGLPDFSPANQDRAAWYIAQQDYGSQTGRNLAVDLSSGDPAAIANVRGALSNTWEGLKGLSNTKFQQKLAGGASAPLAAQPDGSQPLPAGMSLMNAVKGDRLPAQQAQAPGLDDANDDILNQWLKGTEASQGQASTAQQPAASPGSAPAAAGTPEQSGDDVLNQFVQSGEKEADPSPPQAATAPITLNELGRSASNAVPVLGGLMNRLDAATNATLAPVLNPLFPNDQVKGDTWSDRYANALTQQEGGDQKFAQEHPIANALAGTTGAVAGTLAGARLLPAAFGASPTASLSQNMLTGALGGTAIGGADAAIRSGRGIDDPQMWGQARTGAEIGGLLGGAAPVIAKGIGMGANKLLNAFSGTSPEARNVLTSLQQAGMTPEEAQSVLTAMGPQATLADINPALTAEAGGLASMGGEPTAILKNAYGARAKGADDQIGKVVNDTLGPAPPAEQILADIRARAEANAPTAQTARSALDSAMGTPVDPHTQLKEMIATRTAAAAPLYKQALDQPIAWNDRLQQFIDDPIMQSALAKGVRIQRLESLKDGTPFDPKDYAITGFNEAGDPIISGVPNFKTLNVAKKGLDALVRADQDPITGRLSDEGRAIDGVRQEFLATLDKANPLYAQARQAWAGPSQAHDAFDKGLSIFRNQSGPSGVNSTPGALSSWLSTASDGEKEAAQLGARSAFEQAINQASDPAQKAANIASLQANQQKLSAILGPQEAQQLTDQLNAKYTDPVGTAFEKGMGVFSARSGTEGIADTPGAWKNWLNGAPDPEVEAAQQGARQALEQSLTSARQGDLSAARSLLGKSTVNRQKLEMLFPNASKMFDALENQLQMRGTEQNVLMNSKTAERTAIQQKYNPTGSGGDNSLGVASLAGHMVAGDAGAVALPLAKYGYGAIRNDLTQAARNRLIGGTARGLSATGPDQQEFMNALLSADRTAPLNNAMLTGSRYGANALVAGSGQYARQRELGQ